MPGARHPSLDERFDEAVAIVPYDRLWPLMAADELVRIAGELGPAAVRLEHVGSTAVPGLSGKPIVDLQVSVADIGDQASYVPGLQRLGYLFAPDPASPDYHFFGRPAERPRTHHVHVCRSAGEHERRHLALREYLRSHREEAAAYEALKREQAARHPRDRLAYIEGKREHLDELERRALAWAQPAEK